MRALLIAALASLAVPMTAAAQTSAPCTSPESRQFDFWVGKWEVFPAGHPDTKVADSLIETLYGNCAIRENWMPLKGPGGGSLNAWIPDKKTWRQTWLDVGGFADFTGGWNGTAMVIEGVWPQPGHPAQMTRMTYTPHTDGSVEQSGVTSDDGGKTWATSFDLIYIHPKS